MFVFGASYVNLPPPRSVLHPAAGRAAGEGALFPGSPSALPLAPRRPGRVRPPGDGAGREPHDQRRGHSAGRRHSHAALSRRRVPLRGEKPDFAAGTVRVQSFQHAAVPLTCLENKAPNGTFWETESCFFKLATTKQYSTGWSSSQKKKEREK